MKEAVATLEASIHRTERLIAYYVRAKDPHMAHLLRERRWFELRELTDAMWRERHTSNGRNY